MARFRVPDRITITLSRRWFTLLAVMAIFSAAVLVLAFTQMTKAAMAKEGPAPVESMESKVDSLGDPMELMEAKLDFIGSNLLGLAALQADNQDELEARLDDLEAKLDELLGFPGNNPPGQKKPF